MVFQVFSHRVGKKIKLLRKSKGISQEDLSLIVGVNQSQLSKMERGYQSVSCCIICKLAEYFNIKENYFFD